jgi:drug/metabolite transporter (DMT)-like permease
MDAVRIGSPATPDQNVVQHSSGSVLDRGVVMGALAVLGFTFTVHSTRAAVTGFGDVVTGFGRVEIAAVFAALVLVVTRQGWPAPRHVPGLFRAGLLAFTGFPYFLSLGLAEVPSVHGVVVCGLLPMSTAAFAVLRAGERVSGLFWLGCFGGLAAVLMFAVVQGVGRIMPGDAWLLAAVLSGSLGNVEGAKLARSMGGWRAVCWILVLMAPLLALVIALSLLRSPLPSLAQPLSAWVGLAYAALVSSFLAFVAWFRGLALGGIARVAQVQLLQPAFGLVASAVLLGETISSGSMLAAAAIAACAAICLSKRARPNR